MRQSKTTVTLIVLTALMLFGCGQQKPPETGRLVIASEPETGADILLNGRRLEQRTQTTVADLSPGHYVIELVRPPNSTLDTTQTGQAEVEVKSGKLTRVLVSLSPMKLVAAASEGPARPKTRGQQSIFGFYAAITDKDTERAYAHLSTKAQRAFGGSRSFAKLWESSERVEITALTVMSHDPTTSVEISNVTLKVYETTDTTPALPNIRELSITTSEVDFGGPGLPLILEILETSAGASPSS